MKCSICNAELDTNALFCSTCGAEVVTNVPIPEDDRTVIIPPEVANTNGMTMPAAFAQTDIPNASQPVTNAGFTNQPYPQQQNQMSDQQFAQQWQMPNYQTTPMGMNPYGQQQIQPQMQQQTQSRKPRKPLSKGAKIGITCGVLGIILLAVFLVVILPMIRTNKLQGKYTYNRTDRYVIFDHGTYAAYENDSPVDIGTYTLNGNNITIRNIFGEEYPIIYNQKENRLESGSAYMYSTDKKAKLGYSLKESYLDDLEDELKEICEKMLDDDELAKDLKQGATIANKVLSSPSSKFHKQIAEELDYDNNKALQNLLESGILYIRIRTTASGAISVSFSEH